MTVTYRTVVLHIPPTPLGLLPERWAIEHSCNLCRRRVTPTELIAHAQDHEQAERAGSDDDLFQSAKTSGTMAPIDRDPLDDATATHRRR